MKVVGLKDPSFSDAQNRAYNDGMKENPHDLEVLAVDEMELYFIPTYRLHTLDDSLKLYSAELVFTRGSTKKPVAALRLSTSQLQDLKDYIDSQLRVFEEDYRKNPR